MKGSSFAAGGVGIELQQRILAFIYLLFHCFILFFFFWGGGGSIKNQGRLVYETHAAKMAKAVARG